MAILVVHGATMHCNYGSKTCALSVTSVASVMTGPSPVASMFDSGAGENVGPFGTCKAVHPHEPCSPITPLPWSDEWTGVLAAPASALTERSKLRCFKAGRAEITFQHTGQTEVLIQIPANAHLIRDSQGNPVGYWTKDPGEINTYDLNDTHVMTYEQGLEDDPLADFVIATAATLGAGSLVDAAEAGVSGLLERGVASRTIRGLPQFAGMSQSDIEAELTARGFTKVPGRGGDVWTRPAWNRNTAAVRVDDAVVKKSPKGFADETDHLHKETVPTKDVSGGNYPNQKVTRYNDQGEPSTNPTSVHIPYQKP